jgi:hypothetical protein
MPLRAPPRGPPDPSPLRLRGVVDPGCITYRSAIRYGHEPFLVGFVPDRCSSGCTIDSAMRCCRARDCSDEPVIRTRLVIDRGSRGDLVPPDSPPGSEGRSGIPHTAGTNTVRTIVFDGSDLRDRSTAKRISVQREFGWFRVEPGGLPGLSSRDIARPLLFSPRSRVS